VGQRVRPGRAAGQHPFVQGGQPQRGAQRAGRQGRVQGQGGRVARGQPAQALVQRLFDELAQAVALVAGGMRVIGQGLQRVGVSMPRSVRRAGPEMSGARQCRPWLPMR
jgi:hypothetical protein